MVKNRVFTENIFKKREINFDKKKNLFENQNVFRKRSQKINASSKDIFSNDNIKNQYLNNFKIKKESIIIIAGIIFVLLCVMPIIINTRSYIWEKDRILKCEDDVVYNQFLIDSLKERDQGEKGLHAKYQKISFLQTRNYKVIKGDSLFGIANRFNVSIDSIITLNNLKNAYYLKIGTVLKVPNMSGILYKVKRGDNLSSIARRYRISVNRIADANDLPSSTIHIGQKIFIPDGVLSAWDRALAIGSIFKRPTKGRLTSGMGFRIDPFTGRMAYHLGIDIANRLGTPVYSSRFGRVTYAGRKGNYGKTVVIVHPGGYSTLYAHLSKVTVKRGETVKQGERIGLIGSTGRSTGPHLHFEVHQGNRLIDPLKIMKIH